MKNIRSILKFNLDSQEGRDAHFRACKADMAYRALYEIEERMKRLDISEFKEYQLKPYVLIEKLRKDINKIITDNGIDLLAEYK